MSHDVEFQSDLYHGAADDYDRFRVGYPDSLLDDILRRSGSKGQGMLLDLACGTGQIAFSLARHFSEVWAVDQEPDMISVVRKKAMEAGLTHIHSAVSAAESFSAPLATFELVTVGNAFHRLRRDTVAASIFGWLKPGGHVALVWCGSPWLGDSDWQRALADVLSRWKTPSTGRIPDGWEESRRRRTDRQVLTEAYFDSLGVHSFAEAHCWTFEDLIGFLYSTSFLPRHALGALASDFEADMHSALDQFGNDANLTQTIDFSYDLYRRA